MNDKYINEILRIIRSDVLYDGETYETIPVISRYRTVDNELKDCDGISKSRILLSLAISILGIARELSKDEMFFAISFHVEDFKTEGYIQPNIVVSRNAEYIGYFANARLLHLTKGIIYEIFDSVIGVEDFSIRGSSRTEFEKDGEIILIPKTYINLLEKG